MENRIKELFKNKSEGVLSVFFTAGFPQLNDTITVATSLQNAGADMIEIGIPFSDPVADGPTIQESSKVALANGITLKLLLGQVEQIRSSINIPIVLMGYVNPVMQFGMDAFISRCGQIGVDGLIIPDMPLHEYEEEYASKMREANICNTLLITPTTSPERIRRIDAISDGFIYAVSASSTTGTKEKFSQAQIEYFQRLKSMKLKNPFLIGFGIGDQDAFASACKYGSGAIVGSAFINNLKTSSNLRRDTEQFIGQLKSVAIKETTG